MQKYEKKMNCVKECRLKSVSIHRIVMAATNDLATDRRVQRHATALREAGYEVVTMGRDGESCKADIAVGTRHRRGWRFYAEYNRQIAKRLRGEHFDVVWANDSDTLPGCHAAARRMKARLVLDAHELFPEVPEIQRKPLVKWVWRTVERQLFPRCDAMLTVCRSVADHYRRTLGVEMAVVRNVPGKGEAGMPADPASGARHPALKTLLYQGAVNLGRGVDWAIDALEWLPCCRLVVAGGGDLLEQMKAYAASRPWADRVLFLGRLMPDELTVLTRQADVGLVMLEDMGLSYHYALPNRVGDFVDAGVPMVVSDLPEMAAVVRRFDVGEVIESGEWSNAEALAKAVRKVLARGKENYDFAEARADMDWDKEKLKLIEIMDRL